KTPPQFNSMAVQCNGRTIRECLNADPEPVFEYLPQLCPLFEEVRFDRVLPDIRDATGPGPMGALSVPGSVTPLSCREVFRTAQRAARTSMKGL
ncbi:MAG: hypothetical protein O2868_17400, partial [Proteobacteria bacterium]|nr:hypothetical protein [Pseudomonadota bacterium]